MKQPIYDGTNEDECEYYSEIQGEIEYNKMQTLKAKLNKVISKQVEMVNKYGSNTLSTCDHYNWDKDIWNHRYSIVDKLIDLGFNVDTQMNWGVLDITITKELTL